jgi:hypothetical protein
MLVDPGLDAGLERSHRTPDFGEPLCELDFELSDVLVDVGDSGEAVARQHAHGELVRVVKKDCVVDRQTEGGRDRHRGCHRTREL